MRVKLEEVCKRIYAGGDVPKDRFSEEKTEEYPVPIYANAEKDNGLYGYTDKAREEELSITVAARGTIGFTAIRREPFLPVVRLITVVPDTEKVSVRYLYYVLKNCKPQSSGTSIPQLTVPDIKKNSLELYDISEQERIADQLDRVNRVIELRKQELESLDELIKARFVELFGDPMVNPNRYPIKTYGELFELNAGGTPSKTKPEYWENGTISWIGSNLCQNVILYENDGKYISQEGYDHSSARLFPVDTVLIALVGATIGKTALLKFETSTNQNVLGVRHIAESGYNPMFVYYYTQFLYQKFMNIGDGGFSMASKGFVSELPMYDIDLTEQNEFVVFAEQVDKSKFVA